MREIKFRAWDSFNSEMLKPNDCNGNKKDLSWFFSQYDEAQKGGNKLFLMQFTGLKDKNGVEIYEGDIVISRISGGFNFEPKVVDFTLGSFGIEDHHLHELVEIEVIGNIYENPDMINHVATQTPKAE